MSKASRTRATKTSQSFTKADQAVSCKKLTRRAVLAAIKAGRIPDLRIFDKVIVSISGGKDSQAQLDYVHEHLSVLGIADRLVVAHADLGRIEWLGTKELAAEHAAHYGARFEVVERKAVVSKRGLPISNFLEWVVDRRVKLDLDGKSTRAWPQTGACNGTSDFKTAQIAALATRLAKEVQKAEGTKRQVKILDCVGLTKDESDGREKSLCACEEKYDGLCIKVVRDTSVQQLVKWYPIADWSIAQVWARIAKAGTRHHFCYDLGMSRCSCCFCICSSEPDLRIAAEHNPELGAEYIELEKQVGDFKATKTLASIIGDVVEANAGAERTQRDHGRLSDGKVHLRVA
jgi:3'-phosphoadenosine 5'-phosphosulfate sulfotransferase (PAPS reductase)/FAD synthetase